MSEALRSIARMLSATDGEAAKVVDDAADDIAALRRDVQTHKNNSDHWRGRAEYAEQLLRKRDSRIEEDAEWIEGLRAAFGRIAGMEQPPGGLSQMVGMMKQIAQKALRGEW